MRLPYAEFEYLDQRFFKSLSLFIAKAQNFLKAECIEDLKSYLIDLLKEAEEETCMGLYLSKGYGFRALHLAALLGNERLVNGLMEKGERFVKDRAYRMPDQLAKIYGHMALSEKLVRWQEEKGFAHFMQEQLMTKKQNDDLMIQKKQLQDQIAALSFKPQEVLLPVEDVQSYWIQLFKLRQKIDNGIGHDISLSGDFRGRDKLGLISFVMTLRGPEIDLDYEKLREPVLERHSLAFKKIMKREECLRKFCRVCEKADEQSKTLIEDLSTIAEILNKYVERLCGQPVLLRESLARLPVFMVGAGIAPVLLNTEAGLTLAPPLGVARMNRYGTSTVRTLAGIHFKEKPYAPGVEYMVDHLSHLLVGEGTTPTELLKIIDSDGIHRPYLASKTVVGLNLEDVLHKYPDFIEKIKPSNFSAMILLALLIDPEDGKADNYMARLHVEKENDEKVLRAVEIIGIDNDIAFSDPIVMEHIGERRGVHYVNVKNVMYFFPQMQSLVEQSLKETFLKRVPELVMIDWLQGLWEKNLQYEALLKANIFSLKEYQGDGGSKISGKGLQLPIKLVPKTSIKLYKKLLKIHDILIHGDDVTHNDLFEKVEPILYRYYKEVAQKAKREMALKGGNSYIWRAIEILYENSSPTIQDLVNLQSHIHTEYASSIMTSMALKTAKKRGYEDKRIQSIVEATEEFIAHIDYTRFPGELALGLYQATKALTFVKTPLLHLAVKGKNFPMIRFLTNAGESLHQKDKRGLSALHIAASLGDPWVVDHFVQNQIPVDLTDHLGETPLKKAEKRCQDLRKKAEVETLTIAEQALQEALRVTIERLKLYDAGEKPPALPERSRLDVDMQEKLLQARTRLQSLERIKEKKPLSVYQLEQLVALRIFIAKLAGEKLELSDLHTEAEIRLRHMRETTASDLAETPEKYEAQIVLYLVISRITEEPVLEIEEKVGMLERHLEDLSRLNGKLVSSDEKILRERNLKQQQALRGLKARLIKLQRKPEYGMEGINEILSNEIAGSESDPLASSKHRSEKKSKKEKRHKSKREHKPKSRTEEKVRDLQGTNDQKGSKVGSRGCEKTGSLLTGEEFTGQFAGKREQKPHGDDKKKAPPEAEVKSSFVTEAWASKISTDPKCGGSEEEGRPDSTKNLVLK